MDIKKQITLLTNQGLEGERNEIEVFIELKILEDHIKACKK